MISVPNFKFSNFQMKLSKDIKEVKTSNYIWVRSDKSKNIYKIKPSKYQEILKSKITNNYKIDYDNTIEQIDKDTSKFAGRLQIEDRLGKFKFFTQVESLFFETVFLQANIISYCSSVISIYLRA